MARSKPCGVCTRRSGARGTSPTTTPASSTVTVVSTTGSTGTTASAPSASAASTRATTSGGVSGRAASCTRTAVRPCSAGCSRAAASAARTEAVRVSPPTTTCTSAGRTAAKAVCCGAGTATTTSSTPPARSASTAQQTSGRPPSGTSALGSSAPRRRPLPAAATMPTACTGVVWVSLGWSGVLSGSGCEDLVEEDLRLVLVGALGERELADQNLARLGEHALLTGGQAAVLVAAPQVAYDLGDLVHVTRGQLLEVGFVAAGPVRRLLGVRRAQHLEDPVEPILTDDIAHADDLCVVGRHAHGQVALGDLQHEVGLLFTLDDALLDRFDERGAVVRVDDGLADSEAHVCMTPFADPRLPRKTVGRIRRGS